MAGQRIDSLSEKVINLMRALAKSLTEAEQTRSGESGARRVRAQAVRSGRVGPKKRNQS